MNYNILEKEQLPPDWQYPDSDDSEKEKNKIINNWKERSLDPRRNFRRSNKGVLNPGEIKVFDKLDRIGHIHRDSQGYLKNEIDVDSLLESAFDSEQNK